MEQLPDQVTPEWLAKLDADGWSEREKKTMIQAVEKNAERKKAREELEAIDKIQQNRRDEFLNSLTEAQIDQCALISVDPDKGILLVARKLQKIIDAHVENTEGPKGKINTIMDYITAHILMLDDVQMSKKPIHDLRRVHTEEDAALCGISHRNLSLIWKCVLSISKDMDKGAIGNETELAALAAEIRQDAEKMRQEQKDAAQTLSRATVKQNRLQYARQARRVFGIPEAKPVDLKVQKGEKKAPKRGKLKSVDFEVYEGDGTRITDHGSGSDAEAEKLRNENMDLIKKLGG